MSRWTRREFLKLSALVGLGYAFEGYGLGKAFAQENESNPFLLKEVSRNDTEKGIIRPRNLPVVTLPMTRDFRYDPKGVMKISYLEGNMDLAYKGTVVLRREDGSALVAAPLSHVTGEQNLPVAILEFGEMVKGSYVTGQRFYEGISREDSSIEGDYVYMAGPYPNKIYNLLRSVEQILINQNQMDGFKAGQEVSYRNLINLTTSRLFRLGLTLSGEEIGGGACAGASVFCKTAKLTGNVDILEMWGHRPANRTYWASPVDPSITAANSDASVDLEHDLRVRFKKDYYLKVAATVVTTAGYVKESVEDLKPGGDQITFSLALTTKKPDLEGQLTKIQTLLGEYGQYRDSKRQVVGPTIHTGQLVTTPYVNTDQGFAEWKSVGEETYPAFRSDLFTDEFVKRGDLSEIAFLAARANEYSTVHPLGSEDAGLGTYLKNTDWYRMKKSEMTVGQFRDLEGVLGLLDRTTYYWGADQAIQCVGWVALLAKLGYNTSPKYIGGIDFLGPAVFVPERIKNLGNGNVATAYVDGLSIYGGDIPMSEIREGDLFIEYNSKAGHVGAVVAKKEVNGKTVLLISEANRATDGKVIFRQITNQTELQALLGPWPNKIVLIRQK